MASESVDLIYLDPPFNSNRDYSAPIGSKAAGAHFKDTWTLDDVDVSWKEEIGKECPALQTLLDAIKDTAGNSIMSYSVYMAVRLIEMYRILKSTGSLYLHCDPTMSHYLKIILDAIFGSKQYRGDIIWKRHGGHTLSSPRKFEIITDHILFYSKTGDYKFMSVRVPMGESTLKKYSKKDQYGVYSINNLTGGKAGGEAAYMPFKGVTPPPGRAWAPVKRENMPWKAREKLSVDYEEMNQLEKCYEMDRIGLIHWAKSGKPYLKVYLKDSTVAATNLWDDIKKPPKSESLGYPTQKPLALLERIIRASTDANDTVFDPFCGCATACSAAERLNRRWIGIDISEKAVELIKERLKKEYPLEQYIDKLAKAIHRTDIPVLNGRRSPGIADILYGKQKGYCAGCGTHFQSKNLTVDHKTPTSKGGQDIDENLQLLCGYCNSKKGDRTMAELMADLKKEGIGTRKR